MANRTNRYKQMESYMTIALIAATVLFVLYMIFAGIGLIWLKVILAALIFFICAACLAILYFSKEIHRQRSLWMTTAAAAISICLLASLILNFPCPSPYA